MRAIAADVGSDVAGCRHDAHEVRRILDGSDPEASRADPQLEIEALVARHRQGVGRTAGRFPMAHGRHDEPPAEDDEEDRPDDAPVEDEPARVAQQVQGPDHDEQDPKGLRPHGPTRRAHVHGSTSDVHDDDRAE